MANQPRHYPSLPEPSEPTFRKRLLGELKLIIDQIEDPEVYISEAPSGTIDGVNKTFTISFTPEPNTQSLYLTGLFQRPGSTLEYIISGTTIIFTTAPSAGPPADWLWITYIKAT